MTPRIPKSQLKRRRYSPEERERGLTALVMAGSSFQASEVTGIDDGTLRDWKHKHPDQFARLQKDLEPQVVDKIAAEAEGIVLELAGIQRGYAQRMRDTMYELKPGEIPGAMRNAATAAALNVDKLSSPLRERPSHVKQDADILGVMARIARQLGFQAIDSTATEITTPPVSLPNGEGPNEAASTDHRQHTAANG